MKISDIVNKPIVVNCKTAKEYLQFESECLKQGYKWLNDTINTKNNTLWALFNENTCYTITDRITGKLCLWIGEKSDYIKEGYQVVNFADFQEFS